MAVMNESESNPDKQLNAEQHWQEARTYSEICELTAQFIEGRSPFIPGYDSVPDEETEEITGYLAAMNRAGFLTTGSQPGEHEQRAFVNGFAHEHVARRIARVTLYTDLYVLAAPPWAVGGYHIPVGLIDFRPCIWSGFSSAEFEWFEEVCSTEVMRELVQTWSISAIDLSWGRKDYLWQNLCAALCCYTEEPADDFLDTSFVGRLTSKRSCATDWRGGRSTASWIHRIFDQCQACLEGESL